MMCVRHVNEMPKENQDLLMGMCVDAIPDDVYALFWSREDADRRNTACNDATGGEVLTELSLGFKYRGTNAARELAGAVREFVAELPSEGRDTVLRKSGLVMLLTNLDVSGGAYRGATGTVAGIIRDAEQAVTGVQLRLNSQPAGAEPVLVQPMVETISKVRNRVTLPEVFATDV